MASKHDGKHARANMWVTHQNLARSKGGRPGFQFKERPPRVKPVPPPTTDAATTTHEEPTESTSAAAEEKSTS